MTFSFSRRAAALGLAGAIALAAVVPASAAPISGNAALMSSLPAKSTEVRWRNGAWVGAGVAAGLVLGGIAASRSYYGPGYYGPGYGYYGAPYAYGPAPVYVEPEPVYVAPPRVYAAPQPNPGYGVRQCWVVRNQDTNAGYWAPC